MSMREIICMCYVGMHVEQLQAIQNVYWDNPHSSDNI